MRYSILLIFRIETYCLWQHRISFTQTIKYAATYGQMYPEVTDRPAADVGSIQSQVQTQLSRWQGLNQSPQLSQTTLFRANLRKSSSSSSSSCRAISTDIPDPLFHSWPLAGLQGYKPVFSHSCCMYVRAGRPAFAWPYVGVHRSTSLMSSSLLLQQCPSCLFRLAWIVFVIGGRWPYSWCLVGCCRQYLFNIGRNILV